ncbi:MAG: hypothetical protein LBI13_01970 [Streptococcaceae bacterium]|jgi:hypothetical protein|nr:hypothetical protein [Streptococcaceae bacterium]
MKIISIAMKMLNFIFPLSAILLLIVFYKEIDAFTAFQKISIYLFLGSIICLSFLSIIAMIVPHEHEGLKDD